MQTSLKTNFVYLTILAACCLGSVSFFAARQFRVTTELSVDETYLIVVQQEYEHIKSLYDEVYSQYGPFFHQSLHAVFSWFSLDWTPSDARWVWFIVGLLVSFSFAHYNKRQTNCTLSSLFTFLAVTYFLAPTYLPSLHPGAPILLFCLLCAIVSDPFTPLVRSFTVGLLVAATLLSKINLGIFQFIAILPFFFEFRRFRFGFLILIFILPFLLSAKTLFSVNTVSFVVPQLVYSLAVLLITLRTRFEFPKLFRIREFGAGFLTLCFFSISIAILTGSTWSGIYNGIFLGPSQHSTVIQLVHPNIPATFWVLAVGLFLMLFSELFADNCLFNLIVGLTSILAVFIIRDQLYVGFFLLPPLYQVARFYPNWRLYSFIGLLHFHSIFPVMGHHITWGTCWGIAPAVFLVRESSRKLSIETLNSVVKHLGLISVCLFLFLSTIRTPKKIENLKDPSLGDIHTTTAVLRLYKWIRQEVPKRCESIYSMPGDNFVYLVLGWRPPTSLNTTAWMYLFSEATQQKLLTKFKNISKFCVLRSNDGFDYFKDRTLFSGKTPLVDYFSTNFYTVAKFGNYQLQSRKEPQE